jgi:hypothetical protein
MTTLATRTLLGREILILREPGRNSAFTVDPEVPLYEAEVINVLLNSLERSGSLTENAPVLEASQPQVKRNGLGWWVRRLASRKSEKVSQRGRK